MGRARARIIFGCLALVLGAAAWMGLAPAALGGGVTYATITGTSMEPKLHRGDLVALRAAPSYRVGDVVGYRDASLHRLVLHRIVAGDERGFVMQGDNNDFRDPTHPTADQVVGRLWTHVPQAGAVVGRFRSPGSAALLVGALVLLPTGRRRRKAKDGESPVFTPFSPPPPFAPPTRPAAPPAPRPSRDMDTRRGVVAGLAIVALGLAALAGYAYSRPASQTVTVTDAFQQTGTFSYSATATRGAAYPDGVVRTGDAVFPRLSTAVRMSFDYRLTSAERADVGGTAALEAVVTDNQGWKRVVPLSAPTAFTGGGTTLTGTLRLDRLRAMVRAFERETGTKATQYSVSIAPRINVSGDVGGTHISTDFTPSLPMQLDATRLALGTTQTGEQAAVESTRSGTLLRDGPAALSLGGFSLPVFRARAIGLLGFEALLGAVILIGLPILLEARRSEAGAIRIRMGGRLVDVAELPRSAPGGCVDLERMSDLAKLAERTEVPIMVAEGADRARYGVMVGDVLYRYSTRPPAAAPAHGGRMPMVA